MSTIYKRVIMSSLVNLQQKSDIPPVTGASDSNLAAANLPPTEAIGQRTGYSIQKSYYDQNYGSYSGQKLERKYSQSSPALTKDDLIPLEMKGSKDIYSKFSVKKEEGELPLPLQMIVDCRVHLVTNSMKTNFSAVQIEFNALEEVGGERCQRRVIQEINLMQKNRFPWSDAPYQLQAKLPKMEYPNIVGNIKILYERALRDAAAEAGIEYDTRKGRLLLGVSKEEYKQHQRL